MPAALAADWLTSAWDENAGLYACGPAASVIEEVAGVWLLDILGLPSTASFAFVTGCQMAHVTALAAARHRLLDVAGWDVERDGLTSAPPISVLVGEERHATVDRALRFLVSGDERHSSRGRGRARSYESGLLLQRELRSTNGPVLVCAQAGNVNTGSIDPLADVCAVAQSRGAWVHVDGAFGSTGRGQPALRPLVRGVEEADSWATDAHKWLNVPYDCGLAFVAHPESHRAALGVTASYLIQAGTGGPRDPVDWTLEFSLSSEGDTCLRLPSIPSVAGASPSWWSVAATWPRTSWPAWRP